MAKDTGAMDGTIKRRASAFHQFSNPLWNLIEICQVESGAEVDRAILGESQRLLKCISTPPAQD
jgi:hypothetical protein